MVALRVGACQINPVVGDLDGNVGRVLAALREADAAGCDLAVFSELVLTGYPPEDLLLKSGFVSDNLVALQEVAAATGKCAAVVGFADLGRDLHNAAAMCAAGQVAGIYHKRLLPNYGVFDEQRYFAPGQGAPTLFVVGGVRVGLSVCEDAWSPTGPIAEQAAGGAELMVNLNASPYCAGRRAERTRMLATRAADSSCTLVWVNQVGGQDELVFDGGSAIYDENGATLAAAGQFDEEVMVVDVEVRPVFRKRLLDPRGRHSAPSLTSVEVSNCPRPNLDRRRPRRAGSIDRTEEVYRALVLGTHDYVTKNGFSDVVIGLSGGIDSSLVATVAVDALGPDHVHGVAMPSRFSSEGSLSDATALARGLGIQMDTVPIEAAHVALSSILASVLDGEPDGLTEENLQSRIRGLTLMAISNARGWMVLTTGNKSEVATGYFTLYGDSVGGFAVIKDVPKTLVYRLCKDRNARAETDLVPASVLSKAPSAELRPDQRDDQSLPAYEALDPVLEAYVEGDLTASELVTADVDPALVHQVVALVDTAEYKRRQTPPGVRVTPKAFGKDRRLPITNRYSAHRRE
ncbi:MAG: NAD+ synthase [Acidimicrobiales bacterium]|nr:MAG: NAD+ synthase [Acidimicrobiales bacterium]